MQKVFRTTQTCDLLGESRTVNHQKSLFSGQRKKVQYLKSRIYLKLKDFRNIQKKIYINYLKKYFLKYFQKYFQNRSRICFEMFSYFMRHENGQYAVCDTK